MQKVPTHISISLLSVIAIATVLPAPLGAYPEFQSAIEKNSARTVNCAFCHTNANGPQGNSAGQIGALSPKEMETLNAARLAMEPEQLKADSPILNKFGNSIIRTLGKKKFLESRQEPMKLAELLGTKSDLDGDGIPDSIEFLDGTDPQNKLHGDPWKLFCVNIDRYKFHILLALLACILLDWGFVHLIRGFALKSKARKLAAKELSTEQH